MRRKGDNQRFMWFMDTLSGSVGEMMKKDEYQKSDVKVESLGAMLPGESYQ